MKQTIAGIGLLLVLVSLGCRPATPDEYDLYMPKRYPCPCCGFLTLSEPPPGTFEICPVCYWEDDNLQYKDPELAGGANKVSLNQARANCAEFGAVSRESVAHVRKPRKEEAPE